MNNIIANVSAGGVILNDYILKIEDIPGGHRLRIARGSDVQVLDIMDHDLTIDGGKPGQVVGFNDTGNAVPMDLPETGALYVNLTAKEGTNDRYTADKTKTEVETAHKAGRAVYCVLDGALLPLNRLQYTPWAGGVSLDAVMFVGLIGAAFCSVDTVDHTNVHVEKYGLAVDISGTPIVYSTHPSQASGKLYYADSNGMLAPLALGSGLKIINGVLTLNSDVPVAAAICGNSICGNSICGQE